jgi:hypothetical protein
MALPAAQAHCAGFGACILALDADRALLGPSSLSLFLGSGARFEPESDVEVASVDSFSSDSDDGDGPALGNVVLERPVLSRRKSKRKSKRLAWLHCPCGHWMAASSRTEGSELGRCPRCGGQSLGRSLA